MPKIPERTLEAETRSAENAKGVWLKDVAVGEKLRVATKNTEYILEHREDGFYLSGHAKYCPTPKKVELAGSTWGGHSIMSGFIGENMRLEITSIEGYDIVGDNVRTSEIKSVERIDAKESNN